MQQLGVEGRVVGSVRVGEKKEFYDYSLIYFFLCKEEGLPFYRCLLRQPEVARVYIRIKIVIRISN